MFSFLDVISNSSIFLVLHVKKSLHLFLLTSHSLLSNRPVGIPTGIARPVVNSVLVLSFNMAEEWFRSYPTR